MNNETKYKLTVDGYEIKGDVISLSCYIKGLENPFEVGYTEKEISTDSLVVYLSLVTEHKSISDWEEEEPEEYRYTDFEMIINKKEGRNTTYYQNEVFPDLLPIFGNALNPNI